MGRKLFACHPLIVRNISYDFMEKISGRVRECTKERLWHFPFGLFDLASKSTAFDDIATRLPFLNRPV